MTWTGAAGYCTAVLVFLCCLDPSLQGCANYFEDLWKNPLLDHYIPLQRLLPNQTLEDVVKNTLNNWCCKSVSPERDSCDILNSCFEAVCDNSTKPLPWSIEMVSVHQFYCLIANVTNLTSKTIPEMCQARGPAYNCMLEPTETSSPSPFTQETTTVSRENAAATPEANVTSYDSIRGLNTNLSTGIQSVLCVLLISSNAAWLVYFWQRRGQQQQWRSTGNGLRTVDIPHSQVLMEERPHGEGHT